MWQFQRGSGIQEPAAQVSTQEDALVFERPVTEIIRARVSWRSYRPDPLAPEVVDALGEAMASVRPPLPGPAPRFELLQLGKDELWKVRDFGTYGMIRGATHFLVGLTREGAKHLESFAYCFEALVLRATELGLGTCWLGGSLNRKTFRALASAGPEEIVPAISPVGYRRERRTLTDSLVRLGAASHKRRPWRELFFDGDFGHPLKQAAAGRYADVLEMVRLGPSASNRQPWRVLREPDGARYHLFLRRSTGYSKILAVDLQRLDIGVAMCHFALTAEALGLPGQWVTAPPELEALPARTAYVVSWDTASS